MVGTGTTGNTNGGNMVATAYLLPFGYRNGAAMGVQGAALATVTGQIIAVIVAIFINIYMNKDVNISMKGFRPSLSTIGQIYAIGIPSIIM